MRIMVSRMLILVAVAFAAACSDATRSMSPSATPVDTTVSSPSGHPAPPFALLSRPGKIYDGSEHLYDAYLAYHRSPLLSRYVLYPDSTFALQFSSGRFGLFEYAGRFSRTNAGIKLSFDAWSTAGPWEATATLDGDAVNVTYNLVMSFADFVDGVYVRSR